MTIGWFVPGRLEVLGTHTDYAGGRSLLAAVDRGVTVRVSDLASGSGSGSGRRSGSRPDEGGPAAFVARSAAVPDRGPVRLVPGTDPGLPAGHWGRYVQAVLDRLTLNFGPLRPARISVESSLPLAAGMSSSSALVTAVALAVADANGLPRTERWRGAIADGLDLAGYMATMENGLPFKDLAGLRGVGTFGGSEDHTAMLNCTADRLTEFRFCPIVRGASVLFPREWSFVIAVSGVLAEKTGAALARYNAVSLRARELVSIWNGRTGQAQESLAAAVASAPDAGERLRGWVADRPALADRLEAFIAESEVLVPRALEAVEAGDLAAFGQVADQSHANSDRLLGIQVPQTNALQRMARELGASGASGFGAGFGGSVWAVVPTADAEAFSAAWRQRYLTEFPGMAGRASVLVTRPGDAAHRI